MILLNSQWLATIIVLFLTHQTLAHGGHSQAPIVDAGADWATKHMAEEHHIQGYDATTFFTLHDFSSSGYWSTADIQRMYGLFDASSAHVDMAHKDAAAATILGILDADHDGYVSMHEFVSAWEERGVRLPDLGFGPGHHGDDEYEYEIHHWEKYHDENTKEEDLTHPEDIEHFKKHAEEDAREEAWEKLSQSGNIVEANIPAKFLRKEL